MFSKSKEIIELIRDYVSSNGFTFLIYNSLFFNAFSRQHCYTKLYILPEDFLDYIFNTINELYIVF